MKKRRIADSVTIMILYTPPKPATHLPLIDLSGAFSERLEVRREVAWEVHKACREAGFFYVKNHRVPQSLIDEQFVWTTRFFDLPDETKRALHMRNSRSKAGYEPTGGQTLDEQSPPDLKESYYCSAELPADHPYVRAGLRNYGANQWPDDLAGFREQMLAYYDAMRSLGTRMMSLIALSLALPESYFASLYDAPVSSVRLIKYPPQPHDARFNQLGAGAHTDWGGITLLLQDDLGGLEVENADGEWLQATPITGTFVVNLGDMIARWSNGLYHSNKHRVLNNGVAGRDRYSIPFFFSPDYNARIECLPSCVDANNPPRYAPCTAGEHLDEMFRRTYGELKVA